MGARRKWTLVTLSALAIALMVAAGVAVVQKRAKDKRNGPPVALEFTPREVEAPRRESLPLQLAFSGPLVAPNTAIVRAKEAGTLLEAECRRR